VELGGRVAVVTGGASGIGAAVVAALDAAGARPVVWDRRPADGPPHAPVATVACDVGDASSVAAALEQTLATAGTPSVLVTAAGVGGGLVPLVDVDPDRWDELLRVNLKGTLLAMQAVARAMRAAGTGGAMVAISSVNARLADRGMAAYCVAKAGVEMLVRVAAAEWGPLGIRVNAVAPGVTDTPMLGRMAAVPGLLDGIVARTPLGRLGRPDDIAAAVCALLAADWVTGAVLVADGGLSQWSPVNPWSAAFGS
jgi:NAD(P)-dependent dehydrogenase (short-subunit alcohol dehydrogenase family)